MTNPIIKVMILLVGTFAAPLCNAQLFGPRTIIAVQPRAQQQAGRWVAYFVPRQSIFGGFYWDVVYVWVPLQQTKTSCKISPETGIMYESSLPQKAPRSLVNYRGRGQLCLGELTMELYQNLRLDGKHIGRRVGEWVQVGPSFNCGDLLRRAVCQCSCGRYAAILTGSLNSKASKRCEGCRLTAFARKTHGLSHTPEYGVWQNMIERCEIPSCKGYEYYGGRGISVCKQWRESVETFYADMGPRPGAGYEIDRIDSNGNYEPNNCRWVTRLVNSTNKARTKIIEYNGQKMTISEFTKAIGVIKRATVAFRLGNGWTPEEIATITPYTGRNSRA